MRFPLRDVLANGHRKLNYSFNSLSFTHVITSFIDIEWKQPNQEKKT